MTKGFPIFGKNYIAKDAEGNVLKNAVLTFYEEGTTKKLKPHTRKEVDNEREDPIVATTSGIMPQVYLPNGVYRAVLRNRFGKKIWAEEDISVG